MPAKAFIDTNVFVYHIDDTDPRKSEIAHAIIREAIVTGNACINSQVVQEFLNTMLRQAEKPLTRDDAHTYLAEILTPLCRVFASIPLYQNALDIQARYRFSFYDSLIVAAALSAGCTRLLTEDLQHGQQIEGLQIQNPFVSA
jgi:predicted nucleic acid-binding protein